MDIEKFQDPVNFALHKQLESYGFNLISADTDDDGAHIIHRYPIKHIELVWEGHNKECRVEFETELQARNLFYNLCRFPGAFNHSENRLSFILSYVNLELLMLECGIKPFKEKKKKSTPVPKTLPDKPTTQTLF